MNKIRIPEQPKQRFHNGHDGMKPVADRVQRHHTQPSPETAVSQPTLFPTRLWIGLWTGILIGAIVGLLFARLLFTGVITPRGWEAIFSLEPFTFHFFWTMLGLSLGLMLNGILAILATPKE